MNDKINTSFVIFVDPLNLKCLYSFNSTPVLDSIKGISTNLYNENIFESAPITYKLVLVPINHLKYPDFQNIIQFLYPESAIHVILDTLIQNKRECISYILNLSTDKVIPPIIELPLDDSSLLYNSLNKLGLAYSRNRLSEEKLTRFIEKLRRNFEFNLQLEAKLSILNQNNPKEHPELNKIELEKKRILKNINFSSSYSNTNIPNEQLLALHNIFFSQK